MKEKKDEDSKVRLHLTPAMKHAPIYYIPLIVLLSRFGESELTAKPIGLLFYQKEESSSTLAYFSKVTSLTESLNQESIL